MFIVKTSAVIIAITGVAAIIVASAPLLGLLNPRLYFAGVALFPAGVVLWHWADK